jgi:hypothetical protein
MDALLECGADVNFRDSNGCTPLLYVTDLSYGCPDDQAVFREAHEKFVDLVHKLSARSMNFNDSVKEGVFRH